MTEGPVNEDETDLHRFLTTELLKGRDQLGLDDPLLDGTLDSFGLMSIVTFIEEHFQVAVGIEEVAPDNFSSVRAIAAFVGAKRAQAST